MANKSRAMAPGTQGGCVRSPMDSPFKAGLNKGDQKNIADPTFNQPRSGGDNGLPTRVTDPMGGPSSGGTGPASQTSSPGTIMTTRGK